MLAAEEFGMGTPDPRLHVEPPHDVLAAEEFGMGTPDPRLHVEPAHDVLAAEEFGWARPIRFCTITARSPCPATRPGSRSRMTCSPPRSSRCPRLGARRRSTFGDAISAAATSERRPLLVAAGLAATFLVLRRRRR